MSPPCSISSWTRTAVASPAKRTAQAGIAATARVSFNRLSIPLRMWGNQAADKPTPITHDSRRGEGSLGRGIRVSHPHWRGSGSRPSVLLVNHRSGRSGCPPAPEPPSLQRLIGIQIIAIQVAHPMPEAQQQSQRTGGVRREQHRPVLRGQHEAVQQAAVPVGPFRGATVGHPHDLQLPTPLLAPQPGAVQATAARSGRALAAARAWRASQLRSRHLRAADRQGVEGQGGIRRTGAGYCAIC
jgi:hypothetical protein